MRNVWQSTNGMLTTEDRVSTLFFFLGGGGLFIKNSHNMVVNIEKETLSITSITLEEFFFRLR